MKKFKCKVCGYVYEGDSAPEQCPICKQTNVFEEITEPESQQGENTTTPAPEKKGLNTNANSYIIMYSCIVVVIVAFLLAFVSSALKPTQDVNVALDKKKQVLAALNIRDLGNAESAEKYKEVIDADAIIDAEGNIVEQGGKGGENAGFKLSSADYKDGRLALYICNVEGKKKFVVPVFGMGLWGPIWGYIAVNEDGRTVFGAYFNHESETAGLGAEIKDSKAWQDKFTGKTIYDAAGTPVLKVLKANEVKDEQTQVDGVTGATLTSNGVSDMLLDGFNKYKNYLLK
jgi:Na+-transporting NADH:ubiquinone oxidoreductase subunit C